MNYIKVATLSEIAPGTMKSFKVSGTDVLVANIDGALHAIGNSCPHAHFSLAKGKLNGCVVTCPMHKADFDVTNGKNLSDAKILFIKMKAKDAHCYKVKLEVEDIMVAID